MIKSWLILGLWAALMIADGLWLVASDADNVRKDEEWHEQHEER